MAKRQGPSRKQWDAYYVALGRFVSVFSRVEATMLWNLWRLAQIKHGQAVLSGVRIEAAMGYVNRIADAEEWTAEVRRKWQWLFTQLGLINRLRNDILHFGVSATKEGERWLISNRGVAHHPSRVRETYVTPSILNDARADLEFIDPHTFLLTARAVGIMPGDALPDLDRELLRRPWRYKPLPQVVQVRTTGNILPKRPRPPRPSRA